jgi:hypothetical protein
MVIHKFKIGGEKGLTFYMLSDTRSRPAGTNSTMGTPEWMGASSEGPANNLAARLSGLKEFSKEEKSTKEEPEAEPAPETPPETEKKSLASIADFVRGIVQE